VERLANPILKRAYESVNVGGDGNHTVGDDDFMGADLDGVGDHTMDKPRVEEID
jgi:hypothetical protein